MNKKKSCVLCRNFISIYKINRTLHGRLGIRILSSRAESISHSFASLTRERYFQHSKIKFVSQRGHVISSIYNGTTDWQTDPLYFALAWCRHCLKNVTKCYRGRSSFRCTNVVIPDSCIMHSEPLGIVIPNTSHSSYEQQAAVNLTSLTK